MAHSNRKDKGRQSRAAKKARKENNEYKRMGPKGHTGKRQARNKQLRVRAASGKVYSPRTRGSKLGKAIVTRRVQIQHPPNQQKRRRARNSQGLAPLRRRVSR